MLFFLIPSIVGAVIGYLTNIVAIKLLFHPRKPIRIFGLKIQGLIPSKSEEFARRVIDFIEDYVRKEDFERLISDAINKAFAESKIAKVLLNPIVVNILERYGFKDRISSQVNWIAKNAQGIISNTIAENIDFRKFLEEKISDFSEEEAEEIFKRFARREMRFIEISGAILGFIIGLVQSLVLYLIR